KGIAQKFSELCGDHLGVEQDLVTQPLMHDTPDELAQPYDVKAWWKGECPAIPGVTMPKFFVVERDYPNTYKRFISLGPLLEKLGNGGKGIKWDTREEVEFLAKLNHTHNEPGIHQGRP